MIQNSILYAIITNLLKTINYEKSKILLVGGIDGDVRWLPE